MMKKKAHTKTARDFAVKNAYFHKMYVWFHAQLAQKILNGI